MSFFKDKTPFLGTVQVLPTEETLNDKQAPGSEFKRDKPAALDVFYSAFSVENPAVAAADSMYFAYNEYDGSTTDSVDPNYDPLDNISGYEEHAQRFQFANNPQEVNLIKSKIDRERNQRQIVEDGGWLGTLATFVAGALDPINLLPFGQAAKVYQTSGSLLKGALITGRSAALSLTASEIALHTAQETRTLGESAANITVGSFIGGILGGAASKLGSRNAGTEDLNKVISSEVFGQKVEKDLTVDPKLDLLGGDKIVISAEDVAADTAKGLGGSVGAAQTNRTQAKVESVFGLEKATGCPNLRLATSEDMKVRQINEELSEINIAMEKNQQGVATKQSAETEFKAVRDRSIFTVYNSINESFLSYRNKSGALAIPRTVLGDRLGFGDGKLNYAQFKTEIAKALRRNDVSNIKEVQDAAVKIRKVIDELKDEAIAAKLLPEDIKSITAPSYLTRVYDRERIRARRDEFKNIVTRWLKNVHPEFDDLDIADIASQLIDKVSGAPHGRLDYAPVPLARGPLKERTFNIPDHLIEDFLVNDVDLVMEQYIKTMAADTALAKRFGSADMAEQISQIRESYNVELNKIKDTDKNAAKLREKIEKRRDSDISDIQAVRDLIRGTFSVNASSVFGRYQFPTALTTIKTLNYARLLGGTVLSALPDMAALVFRHGFTRTLNDAFIPFVRNIDSSIKNLLSIKDKSVYQQSIRDLKNMGIGIDLYMNTRQGNLAEIGSTGVSGLDKFNKSISGGVTYWSGISAWSDMMKTVAGYMSMARILDAATLGKLTQKETKFLAQYGIGKRDLELIQGQFKQFGQREKGRYAANVDQWTSREAYESFNLAVRKMTDNTIVNAGLTDKPLAFSTPVGSIFGQFKSFGFAAYQRYFLSGLQQRDLATVNGSIMMVAMGMMSYACKETLAGREVSDDPNKWLFEGIDRSGLLGFMMDANNMLDRVGLGAGALTGTGPASRYATRGTAEAFLGPTAGLINDAANTLSLVTGSLIYDRPISSQDMSAARRILPYQNVLLFRKIFDFIEDSLRDNLGIKQRGEK